MPVVHVNLWAVLLAGVSSMVVGAIYYADPILGREWKRLSKIDVKKFEKEFPKKAPLLFIAALLTAYLVAHIMYLGHAFYTNESWLVSGVTSAFWLWLGLAATTLFIHNLLEQRPAKLTWIAIGNRLFSLLAMGLILGWLHP